MAFGFFGKLPARADFVTFDCPVGFLRVWEQFLIRGLGQSKLDLGDAWEEAYMTMPIWHFWLQPGETGSDLVGPVTGAFMPSVDRVGRKFPLTVMTMVEPDMSPQCHSDTWFENVEEVLLGALEEDCDFPTFRSSVTALEMTETETDGPRIEDGGFLRAEPDVSDVGKCAFWCRAGTRMFAFECAGVPAASEFHWLILPETYRKEEGQGDTAGTSNGQYIAEDHRR